MLILRCPFCQEDRDELEFSCLGEAFIKRPEQPNQLSDEQWADYVFMRDNPRGWFWEQWQHQAGCRKIFAVRRHSVTYRIEGSWPLSQAKAMRDLDPGESL